MKTIETQNNVTEPSKRPNWVVDSSTPQSLIDDVYNRSLQPSERYFKPPETADESDTYDERYAAWQEKWEQREADPADNWPPNTGGM